MAHERSRSWPGLKGVFFLLLFLVLLPVGAYGQATGTTNVDVQVPNLVILHYFSQVDISLSSADLAGLFDTTDNQGEASGSGFSVDLAIAPTGGAGSVGSAALTLKNAWAVRAINANGVASTTVTITVAAGTKMTGPNGSVIDVTGASINATGDAAGNPITFAAPGIATPQTGDVNLTLDLSDAVEAGSYTGAQYTITATNL